MNTCHCIHACIGKLVTKNSMYELMIYNTNDQKLSHVRVLDLGVTAVQLMTHWPSQTLILLTSMRWLLKE